VKRQDVTPLCRYTSPPQTTRLSYPSHTQFYL
jgi:hypothetical protein